MLQRSNIIGALLTFILMRLNGFSSFLVTPYEFQRRE